MVAWGGLGLPAGLAEEEKLVQEGKLPDIPPDFPKGVLRIFGYIEKVLDNCVVRSRYDPAMHFGLVNRHYDLRSELNE